MNTSIKIFAIAILASLTAEAQTDADALRYSIPFIGSTARSMATGGAFGAIGADFSNLSNNPAGLGLYRKSEFVFTPSVQTTTKKSTFFGTTNVDKKSTLNLQNWGAIFSYKLGKDDDLPEWKYINLGFGMNRYNILSSRAYIGGQNDISSIGNYFVNQANGNASDNLDGFLSGLAYQAYFLNPDTNISGNYIAASHDASSLKQTKTINSVGSLGETVISFAANYANKWYFGGTIGFAKVSYTERAIFTEDDNKNQSKNFKSFTYEENLTTRGNGVNLKLGTVYKPADWIRMGLALHTGTAYGLSDTYKATMTTDFDTTITQTSSADNAGGYSYTLRTPARLIGSVAFIIGKYGFISIDNEWLNYRNMMLSPTKDFSGINNLINVKYAQANNLKFGAEINLKPFAVRLGYAMLGNAFGSGYTSNNATTNYTGGVGYRNNNFFVDVAYVYSQSKADAYYLYSSNLVPSAKTTTQRGTAVVSVGLKW